jgi:hypothetical protein
MRLATRLAPRFPARHTLAALTVLLACALPQSVHALLINLTFATQNFTRSEILSNGRFGAPGNTSGGGTFEGVFNAASDIWESVLHDNRSVNITVGWGALGTGVIAAAAPLSAFGGEIVVSNRVRQFLDATPFQNEEFGDFSESFADLGGGMINVGRGFESSTGLGSGLDLLTTVLHEIGHVLGNVFDRSSPGSSFPIEDGPFAGTELPCADTQLCAHLNLSRALMNPSGAFSVYDRTLISDADLLYVAADGGFHDIELSTGGLIPEPPGIAALALLILAGTRLRRR